MNDLFEEDRILSEHLATLGPEALRELQGVLTAPQAYRDELLRLMVARPDLGDLAQLSRWPIPTRVVRLRLRRAIRDLS
jgi:hypothetical protein